MICTNCHGSGQSPDADWLQVFAQLIMMLGDEHDSRSPMLHPWLASIARNAPRALFRPGVELKQLTEGLAGRLSGSGVHDSIDTARCFQKIVKAAGVTANWGVCKSCNGVGELTTKGTRVR